MIEKYFHEVWPKEEAELKISLETSKRNKKEIYELIDQNQIDENVKSERFLSLIHI